MKNQLVSDNNCNNINSIIPHKIYNKWTKNVGFTFCVGDAIKDRGEPTASVISADGFPLMVGPNFQPSDGNPIVISIFRQLADVPENVPEI